jgi:hypothetical protein
MHNFNTTISAICFIGLLVLISSLCSFLLVPPYYTQNVFRDLDAQKNISLLITGDSLSRCAYNTPLISRELGITSFNLNQTGCDLATDRLILEYAFEKHTIDTVVLNWDIQDTPVRKSKKAQDFYIQLFHAMDSAPVRIQLIPYLLRIRYSTVFFYWSGLYDIKNVPEILAVKTSRSYRDKQVVIFHAKKSPRIYLGQGCFAYRARKDRSSGFHFTPEESDVRYTFHLNDESRRQLRAIQALCNRYGSRLIVVSTPVPKSVQTYSKGWKTAAKKTAVFFAKNGIPYIDCSNNPDFPDADADFHFRDTGGHMLMPYHDDFSRDFCSLLRKKRWYP